MATQRPISTISYNTEPFLREKLNSWVKAHIIQSYMYICHKGEDGDKDHIHLRIVPNKRLDAMDLSDDLREWDGKNKPLGVRDWRNSEEEDWVMYVVHNAEYLRLHGDESDGKIPYEWQDIKANESYDVEVAYVRALQKQKHTNASIIKRLEEGTRAIDLINEGENVFVVNGILKAWMPTKLDEVCKENLELRQSLSRLSDKYETLLSTLLEWGFVFTCDNEGNWILDDTKPYGIEGSRDHVQAP